jgi:outer membrane protein OmpA-like peptidoglycan-associated protein
MWSRWTLVVMLVMLTDCSWMTGTQRYSVFFQPYSSELDGQATETVQDAAAFAKAHSFQPVTVTGFSAPPDPKLDVPGLSAQRAEIVKQKLIAEGIAPDRITAEADGVTDPKTLPSVAVRRVDISVGH